MNILVKHRKQQCHPIWTVYETWSENETGVEFEAREKKAPKAKRRRVHSLQRPREETQKVLQ